MNLLTAYPLFFSAVRIMSLSAYTYLSHHIGQNSLHGS
ncbi:MAG: hypothetical protein KatS3mg130_0617 [Candidatus Sumerlaea sp.]|nr:MAG: hypothetical protein KatS3mg130_0617 [Candidatus Sumerlaea sp.]